jgi:DNA-directed RNA polymerase specialized sigma subunit
MSQTEVIKGLGLPQPKVSRIIASVTKSLKEKLSQLR